MLESNLPQIQKYLCKNFFNIHLRYPRILLRTLTELEHKKHLTSLKKCVIYKSVMDIKMEQLKKILAADNIKPTYIRLKILNYLKRSKAHPTADMIYEYLLKEIPTISKMSVYNTLNIFSEKGIALSLTMTGTETRFDGDVSSHHHFLCEKCGKIIDLNIACKYFSKGAVEGNRINELHGYFNGICKKCVKKTIHKKEVMRHEGQ